MRNTRKNRVTLHQSSMKCACLGISNCESHRIWARSHISLTERRPIDSSIQRALAVVMKSMIYIMLYHCADMSIC